MRSAGKSILFSVALFFFWGSVFWIGYQLLTNPDAGLPRAWNPLEPLEISDPVTPFTPFKVRRAAGDVELCLAALSTGQVTYRPMDDFVQSAKCGIANRVLLSGVGQAGVAPVETQCSIALRMAMWEAHDLRPAATDILGATLARIDHLSSYNCREIRTPSGSDGRMSTHATAEAIDISGFRFAGRGRISLIGDWVGDDPEAEFLRAARDGACKWFQTTLGPEFNALHADHFHLQSRGWGTCR